MPGSLDALIAEGYYEGISSNPYTGKQMIVVESPQQIRTGTIYFEAVVNSTTGQVDECWFTICGVKYFNTMTSRKIYR